MKKTGMMMTVVAMVMALIGWTDAEWSWMMLLGAFGLWIVAGVVLQVASLRAEADEKKA